MSSPILIQGTHGAEHPERATLPFIIGNVSASADQDTTIFLTSDAVWMATLGYADDVSFGDHPPAGKILAEFVEAGGRIWVCGACTGPRGITTDQLVDGATVVTAANIPSVCGVVSIKTSRSAECYISLPNIKLTVDDSVSARGSASFTLLSRLKLYCTIRH